MKKYCIGWNHWYVFHYSCILKQGNWWTKTSALQDTLNEASCFLFVFFQRPPNPVNIEQLSKTISLDILFFNCVIQTQWKAKIQFAIAGKYRQTHCAAPSYFPSEFPPVVVRSGFIKLECQKSKKDKSHVIKKYPALLPVSDLNILVLTDTNWRRKPQVQRESTKQPLWNHQSAAVAHLFIRFVSAIHPVFRSVISFPFGKFPEHSKENASTDGVKIYLFICRRHFCSLITKS